MIFIDFCQNLVKICFRFVACFWCTLFVPVRVEQEDMRSWSCKIDRFCKSVHISIRPTICEVFVASTCCKLFVVVCDEQEDMRSWSCKITRSWNQILCKHEFIPSCDQDSDQGEREMPLRCKLEIKVEESRKIFRTDSEKYSRQIRKNTPDRFGKILQPSWDPD